MEVCYMLFISGSSAIKYHAQIIRKHEHKQNSLTWLTKCLLLGTLGDPRAGFKFARRSPCQTRHWLTGHSRSKNWTSSSLKVRGQGLYFVQVSAAYKKLFYKVCGYKDGHVTYVFCAIYWFLLVSKLLHKFKFKN
jgi:hypothetical protein